MTNKFCSHCKYSGKDEAIKIGKYAGWLVLQKIKDSAPREKEREHFETFMKHFDSYEINDVDEESVLENLLSNTTNSLEELSKRTKEFIVSKTNNSYEFAYQEFRNTLSKAF